MCSVSAVRKFSQHDLTLSVAHYSAWKAGFIHRDISAGNVLIRVDEVIENNALVTTRSGMLADWEMSTAVIDGDAGDECRAIDRTVRSISMRQFCI